MRRFKQTQTRIVIYARVLGQLQVSERLVHDILAIEPARGRVDHVVEAATQVLVLERAQLGTALDRVACHRRLGLHAQTDANLHLKVADRKF